ncbi:TetR/AcrR family transcriptional regulator [Aquabacterium sp.]|uniref:TetR/AcrR family transcriptional regulator n=1 Tax=Aquabacterium sp. TaxID=1872578 RepID=UPI002486FDF4|nr:TetR/AcrR family transcriptional regulator [Aquabacterium sp.]MDI1260201.1 TetR/AcrR family transcriptional regulator [Aquabacterium sp.]
MPKILEKRDRPGVRLSAATRRKPQQSRARFSSEALQEAFVRVLLERGYERVTVREVAAVAGVGVGTFYEYVANKEALAALTIHMCVKQLAQALQVSTERHRGMPRADIATAIINDQIDLLMGESDKWLALFLLERRVSSPQAYRKHYDQYVDLWRQALASACDPVAPERLDAVARMVHAIMYGWITQSLMTLGAGLDRAFLKQEVLGAVRAYLREA